MRERVEDLGRLSVLIRNLLDHQLFEDNFVPGRRKDYAEWFAQLSEDKKDDVLHEWVYGIDNIKDKLYEMLDIAEGTDPLNEQLNEQE
jgi:DNA-binding transcriptional regulator GbsR (MarR family)